MQKKDIVKYDNNFNLSNLNKLDKIEQNIFFSICSEFTTQKSEQIQLNTFELKKKANMVDSGYSEEKFRFFLKVLQEKLAAVIFTVQDEKGKSIMPLFKKFHIPNDYDYLQITLNDCFANYLYDIPEKIAFTKFELQLFLELKSKYAKSLFRFLMQNFYGKWEIDFNKFKELMGFPSGQMPSQCLRTIDKAIEQLKNLNSFDYLNYDLEKSRLKGSPIKTITFNFSINNKFKEELAAQTKIIDLETDTITQSVTKGYVEVEDQNEIYGSKMMPVIEKIEIEKKCPNCNGTIYIKTNKQGKKYRACENSKYIPLPNTNDDCNFFELLEEPDAGKENI